MRAFYSWLVQNPSEALYDVMIEVDSDDHEESVFIAWDEKADRNSQELEDAASNQTMVSAPLYGTVVGMETGRNTFTLWYVDAAVQLNARLHLTLLVVVSLLLLRNYF